MRTRLLNYPLRAAGFVLGVEIMLSVAVILMPFLRSLFSVLLLLVALFGVAYMAYYVAESRQQGNFRSSVLLITMLPPAYLLFLAAYIAFRDSEDF